MCRSGNVNRLLRKLQHIIQLMLCRAKRRKSKSSSSSSSSSSLKYQGMLTCADLEMLTAYLQRFSTLTI
jgi:hypothetical protein